LSFRHLFLISFSSLRTWVVSLVAVHYCRVLSGFYTANSGDCHLQGLSVTCISDDYADCIVGLAHRVL